jgi:UDP-sugar pyrophosphorylase
VNDPATGFSPYPGNINQLVFKLEPYLKTLRSTGGIMGEFVNPKYADSDKSRFKKPTRLECMMQDYPKVLPAGARVGFTSAPSWVCYSPCKNNSADAAASIAAGVPAGSPITAESDQYCAFAQLLRTLGAKVDAGPADTFLGIAAPLSPQIVFHPSFAIFFSEIAARVPYPAKVSISRRSSLVVKGNVIIESLSLDGALKLSAPAGSTLIVRAGGHRIVNAGYKTKACGKDAPEATAMRGYVLDKASCPFSLILS